MSLPIHALTTSTARQLPSAAPSKRPALQLISAPAPARSTLPFMVLCAGILLLSLVGALLLNTAMAVSSHNIHQQRVTLNVLKEKHAELTAQVETLGSPSTLQNRAAMLGMVPAGELQYLSVKGKAPAK